MFDENKMKQAMQSYIDTFNSGDAGAVAALYAEDATVEDPVGTDVHRGKEAITAFYGYAVGTGAKLSLDAPIRASQGNSAAMAFTVHVTHDGHPMKFQVIDVMTFNDAYQFTSMRAFWGKTDVLPG